jgi:hypothetical protein
MAGVALARAVAARAVAIVALRKNAIVRNSLLGRGSGEAGVSSLYALLLAVAGLTGSERIEQLSFRFVSNFMNIKGALLWLGLGLSPILSRLVARKETKSVG